MNIFVGRVDLICIKKSKYESTPMEIAPTDFPDEEMADDPFDDDQFKI